MYSSHLLANLALSLLLVAGGLGHAGTIAPGSEYWPAFQKLKEHEGALRSLEQSASQLRKFRSLADRTEQLTGPLLPALQGLQQSPALRVMSAIPGVGAPAKLIADTAGGLETVLQAVSWAHELDTKALRPLDDALRASNELLQSGDEAKVPALRESYTTAISVLAEVEAQLAAGEKALQETSAVVSQAAGLLGDMQGADPALSQSLGAFQRSMSELAKVQDALQESNGSTVSLMQEVLSALPSGEHGRPKAAGPTSDALRDLGRRTRGPAGGSRTAGQEPVPAAPGAQTVTDPELSAPEWPGSADATRAMPAADPRTCQQPSSRARPSPLLFLGGVLVLAIGAGALSWAVMRTVLAGIRPLKG